MRLPVLLVEGKELPDDGGDGPRGHGHDLAAEAHAVGIHFAAEQKLVVGCLLIRDFAHVAVKADVRDVVVAAGIGAAADFDAQLLDFGIAVACELPGQHIGQRQRARNAEIAGGSSGAAGDVGNGARAGKGQVESAKIVSASSCWGGPTTTIPV